jgi:hypothetical protein
LVALAEILNFDGDVGCAHLVNPFSSAGFGFVIAILG